MPPRRPAFDPSKLSGEPAPKLPASKSITVSQLNAMISRTLADHLPGTIYVVGEISNFSRPASGHLYLTLKDSQSEARAVMWRSAVGSLKFKPADGMEVIATGHVDMYTPRGQVQFYIRKLEPRGVGSLELAFRQLHDKLKREGLFEAKHKKVIPEFPRRIAVVTSDTGAAIRDIVTTIRRRYPCVSLLLHPVRVQGEGAAAEIAEAIRRLNEQSRRLGGLDVMIIGRGGGSIEDLWAFNDEVVARAIFASAIPVISAVGHETDTSIADLVADLRAPTPTAAAELAVPVLSEVFDELGDSAARMTRIVRHRVEIERTRLRSATRHALLRDPLSLLRGMEQHLDELHVQLRATIAERVAHERHRMHGLELRLAAAQPAAVYRRARENIDALAGRLALATRRQLASQRVDLRGAGRRLIPVLLQRRWRSDAREIAQTAIGIASAVKHRLQLAHHIVDNIGKRMEATSYRNTLHRGFTITRLRRDKSIIRKASDVKPGDALLTETSDGQVESDAAGEQRSE